MAEMYRFAAAIMALGWCVAGAFAQAGAEQTAASGAGPGKIYELRVYITNPGKLADLHARFREHTMKLFEKHGMENVIYWTLAEDATARDAAGQSRAEAKENTLVYILAHKNKEAADASWAAFRSDPEWQAAAAKSEENGRILAEPPISIYLNPTDFHPGEWTANGKSDAAARLFELRIYNDGERTPATVGRFRDWEAELFRTSGIETLGFWTKADGTAFVYLLGHKDRPTADANWQTFFAGFRGRGRNSNPQPQQNPEPPNPEVQEAAPAGAQATGGEAKSDAPARGEGARQGRGGRGGRGGGGGGIERRWLVPTDYSPRK